LLLRTTAVSEAAFVKQQQQQQQQQQLLSNSVTPVPVVVSMTTTASSLMPSPPPISARVAGRRPSLQPPLLASSSWFVGDTGSDVAEDGFSLEKRKAELLQLGASLDRGQSYNPTSGEYYGDRMAIAKKKIEDLIATNPDKVPKQLQDFQGEWELIFSTVPHGIFRSSPFFLAIQEAYETNAEVKEAFGEPKANLFFRLHELQTCSWGVSKVGRVAQTITSDYVYSEFDTSIFSLTVIPILGWFKLLPTFGGCVVTAAKITDFTKDGLLKMTVDYTTSRPVPGLQGLGDWIWKIKVPVGAIWKFLPWNKGREAECQVWLRYCDEDFRIAEDSSGDFFVYSRPVIPRPLDLAQ